jgi:hypothetical protein
MSNDRDDRTEDVLRRALSAEARGVSPSGDGLAKIQRRVATRAARWRWMRPALVGSVAVAVIAAGIGGYAVAHQGSGGDANVRVADSSSPTPTALPIVTTGFPAEAIFPFTSVADEASWQQQYASGGSMPWITDPEAVATYWLQSYLKQLTVTAMPGGSSINGDLAQETFGRVVNGEPQPVTVVQLQKYAKSWIVVGATDAFGALSFSSPAAGSTISSPVAVTGSGVGADEQAQIQVRDADTPTELGRASVGLGTPSWSTSVTFTPPTAGVGVLVAVDYSPATGDALRIAAQRVDFGTDAHSTAAGGGAFYGVQSGNVTRFDAATGKAEGQVLDASSGGDTVSEVHLLGGTLFYTTGPVNCPDVIQSMPIEGGTTSTVATATPGYEVTGFGVRADEDDIAYFERGCGSRAGKGSLVFKDLTTDRMTKIVFPSLPPLIEGDPVWESDGVHVDAFVRTGNLGYLARYDSASGDNAQPNTNACPGFDIDAGLPGAIATGPDGTLWVASQTGTSMQVVSCTGTKPTNEFTVNGSNTPTSLSIKADGSVLLTDSSGKVWSWNAKGEATQLPDATGVSSATW